MSHYAFVSRSFIALLSYRLFVILCYQITAVVVGWQIYQLTGDALALGLIGLAEVIPYFTSALFAGYAVDRYNKRRLGLMACALLVLMTSALLIYSLLPSEQVQSWGTVPIYAAIALSGFARAFLSPVYNTLLMQLVERSDYARAAGIGSSIFQLAQIGGPAIAGGLLYFGSVSMVYGVTVVFAVLSVMTLWLIPNAVAAPAKLPHAGDVRAVFSDIGQGLRFVFGHQILLSALALDMFAVLFGGAMALLPAFVADVLNSGPETLGLLRAAPAIGALSMGLYLTKHPIDRHAGKILLGAVAGFGACMMVFALSKVLWLSVLALAVSGLFDSVSVVLRSTILQLSTPDDMRGRVSAINGLFIGSSNELGAFESGLAAKWLGLIPSVLAGAGVTFLVVAVTAKVAPRLRALHMKDLM